jgi:hypothetical protein
LIFLRMVHMQVFLDLQQSYANKSIASWKHLKLKMHWIHLSFPSNTTHCRESVIKIVWLPRNCGLLLVPSIWENYTVYDELSKDLNSKFKYSSYWMHITSAPSQSRKIVKWTRFKLGTACVHFCWVLVRWFVWIM